MPRLQALIECVGQALVDKGRKALNGQWPWADVLQDVARAAYDSIHRKLPGPDLRLALADAASCEPHEYDRRVGELLTELGQTYALPFKDTLSDYLWALPSTVRQVLRRPSDPTGRTAPEKLTFYRAEELLPYLPPRAPKARTGHKPGLDGWVLTELLGIGECSSVWKAEDPDRDDSPSALKFATDPETKDRVRGGPELFRKVFTLNSIPGVLPLRSVYLEAEPPCLESPFVYGYDLSGVMFDWKWRYDTPKPEAALKLLRRLASIVAEAHKRGVVHRDLKPSNIMLHPTEGGKFTMWVTDFGWGEIESVRSLELARGGPRGEQLRLAHRGAATTLYASPQQAKKEPPAPTDDVHALGVIWYQLLKRDPTAAAPVGNEWIEEFRPHGFTDSQARVLQLCLATRPDKRPRTAAVLCEYLTQVTVAPTVPGVDDGSKLMPLKSGSSSTNLGPPVAVTSRGKAVVAEAAANQAAVLLGAAGGGPLATGGPASAASAAALRVMKNSVGMTFVRIPAGSFRMGSPVEEVGRRDHEGPEHEVKISQPFYVSVTPVTQAQYERVMDRNPSKFTRSHGGGPEHPAEMVTWPDAVLFCEKLSASHDEHVNNRHYRLPTEAEWEYACRAGTETPWWFGDHMSGKDGVYSAGGGKYGGKSTAPAGTSPANAWGLHDVHGNVNEWVSDWYEEYYYFDSPKEDPTGPTRGQGKVIRGGCWNLLAADCRSAARRSHAPNAASETIGFRVVLTVG
jgi:formylglycine-generating enzyme required for sulfatase activity/serine/threonine protein kinase